MTNAADTAQPQLDADGIAAAVAQAMQPFSEAITSMAEAMKALTPEPAADPEPDPEPQAAADAEHLQLVHLCGQRGVSVQAASTKRQLLEALVGDPAKCEGKSDDYLRALIDSDSERRAGADMPDGTVPGSTGPHRQEGMTDAEKEYAKAEAERRTTTSTWRPSGSGSAMPIRHSVRPSSVRGRTDAQHPDQFRRSSEGDRRHAGLRVRP